MQGIERYLLAKTMNVPEIFRSEAITLHVLAWAVVGAGFCLAIIFDTMTGFMWAIMPAGLVAFLSGFSALPIAIMGGYRAAKERRLGTCLQYGAVCVLSGGAIIAAVAMQLVAPRRH
jgi:hypothetical protein